MWRRFLSFFRRERLDRELSDEIEFHISMLTEEEKRRGLPPEQAVAAARRQFGGIDQTKERYRDARGIPILESILKDCAHAVRMMRFNPMFTLAVTATLAGGIGATTAVFTVANAVLVQPLQIPNPDRMVVLLSTNLQEGTAFSVAEGVFTDWRKRSTSFDAMTGCWNTSMILTGAGQPHAVSVVKATADVFPLLGLHASEGRLFDSSTEQHGRELVALLDEGFWQREFGGRRDLIGGHIVLDDLVYTVIGTVPSSFAFGRFRRPDVWLPLVPREEVRGGGATEVLASLRPGVTHTEAQAEMNVIQDQIRREHREDSLFGVEVRSVHDWVVSEARPALVMLTGAVGLLMMMSCLNIASLLLARGSVRQREFAIRASLGGGHARLTRQVLTENLLLAGLGGCAGLLVATLLVRAVPHIRGFYLPRIDEIRPDGGMMLIAAAVTIASGLLLGVLPAWRSSAQIPRMMLSTVAPAMARTPAGTRLRRTLVIAQLALSLVLLCGAGLLLNSFVRLSTLSVGFSKANVIATGVRLPYKQYDATRSLSFHQRLMDEIRVLPGVLAVSAVDHLPLQTVHFPYQLSVAGHPSARTEAMARHVDYRYFNVLGVPMAAGRDFGTIDDTLPVDGPDFKSSGRASSRVPVILNVEAARRLFGSERDAVGRNLRTNYKQRSLLEVIGVASNVRQLSLKEDPGPQIYLPLRFTGGGYVVARVAPNAGDLSAAIREIVFRLDPAVPAPDVSTLTTWYEREVEKPRLHLLILALFAIAGLVIATTGLYGVVAYTVAQRTHEFGVRVALGARPGDVLQLVMRQEIPVILTGIALRTAGAFATTRLLTTLLYGVRPGDIATHATACLLLSGVALFGCYMPARRAARLDPASSLRNE